jgi:hypothetical protein
LNRKYYSLVAVKNRATPSGQDCYFFLQWQLLCFFLHTANFVCFANVAHNTNLGKANGCFVFPRRGKTQAAVLGSGLGVSTSHIRPFTYREKLEVCNMRPKKYEERYYSPRFSEMASVTIRRLGWALGVPMTQAVELNIKEIALIFPSSLVCPKCKDNSKCHACGFHNQAAAKNATTTETANAAYK